MGKKQLPSYIKTISYDPTRQILFFVMQASNALYKGNPVDGEKIFAAFHKLLRGYFSIALCNNWQKAIGFNCEVDHSKMAFKFTGDITSISKFFRENTRNSSICEHLDKLPQKKKSKTKSSKEDFNFKPILQVSN